VQVTVLSIIIISPSFIIIILPSFIVIDPSFIAMLEEVLSMVVGGVVVVVFIRIESAIRAESAAESVVVESLLQAASVPATANTVRIFFIVDLSLINE
jgi:hypothetical protein